MLTSALNEFSIAFRRELRGLHRPLETTMITSRKAVSIKVLSVVLRTFSSSIASDGARISAAALDLTERFDLWGIQYIV